MDSMLYISFDLKGDFGFFKKGDANDIVLPTYNIIHKPALLGVLGAIIGLKGYSAEYKEFPEYYETLKSIRIGIKPLYPEDSDCYFAKTIVWFNNSSGHANIGTLQIKEQVLVDPGYTVFIELEPKNAVHLRLKELIEKQQAVYNIYLGKNEFLSGIENVVEYKKGKYNEYEGKKISTIFKSNKLKIKTLPEHLDIFDTDNAPKFVNFENLPTSFNEKSYQYELERFTYTNYEVEVENTEDLIPLCSKSNLLWVYMF